MVNNYKEILSESSINLTLTINKSIQHIPSLITPEKKKALMTPTMLEEVDQVIKEMPLGKAPGLDGFIKYFFHYCWSMIKEEVWKLLDNPRLQGKFSQLLMLLLSP
jgi:hypothetical protein